MFNTLYKKCLDLAAHKSSKYYLALVSFVESSFFPIPPDVMVIPMVISKKNDFFKIFLITTIFSVLGGILGYFIGAFFFELGMEIMNFYGYEDKLTNFKNNLINSEGFYAWLSILFLAGFTPLPYKVFTIASGLIGFNILIFIFIRVIINIILTTILILVRDNPKILNVTSLQLTVFSLNCLSRSSFVIFSLKSFTPQTADSSKKPCSIPK